MGQHVARYKHTRYYIEDHHSDIGDGRVSLYASWEYDGQIAYFVESSVEDEPNCVESRIYFNFDDAWTQYLYVAIKF